MNKIKKNILSLIIMITIMVSSFVVVTEKVNAAADAMLTFSPSSTTVADGATFTVDIMINPGTHQISNADLSLTFDQAKLDLTGITNVASLFSVPQASTIGSGTAGYSAGTAFGTNVTASGIAPATSALYATLHFTATAAGSSLVAISSNTAFYADDEPGVNELSSTNVSTAVNVDAVGDDNPPTPPAPTDSSMPVLSNGIPAGRLSSNTTSINLSVITDENATCKYSSKANVAYESMTDTFATTGGTTHTSSVRGLKDDNKYSYYIKCQDSNSNMSATDYVTAFSIRKKTSESSGYKKESAPKRKITVSKSKVSRGDILMERGSGFSKKSNVLLYFSKVGGGYFPPMTALTSASGKFSVSYRVNKPTGKYDWYAVDVKTGKKSNVKMFTVR